MYKIITKIKTTIQKNLANEEIKTKECSITKKYQLDLK